MVFIILLLSNIISISTSGLLTYIVTREIYSQTETRPLPLTYHAGALQGHDHLLRQKHHGLGGQVGERSRQEEGVHAGRVEGINPRRGGGEYRGEMGGTTNARIEIRVDGRTNAEKKNNTQTLEMSDMWAN